MVCPDPVPGTATATGLLTPVDAFSNKSGASFQWQWLNLVTDKSGACAHYRANQVVQGETWLLVTLVGYHCVPGSPAVPDNGNLSPTPTPPTPLTVAVGTPVEAPAGSGNAYSLAPHHAPHAANCHEQGGSDATAGQATFTLVTDALVEATFDLTFAAGQASGTFSAPVCDLAGCPPRPPKPSCVAS